VTAQAERLATTLSDRYRIERELGQGGMATVFLAEDIKHHRKVAIKVLHPELSAVLGTERFLKEIELTASLQHPHILPLFDSGSADSLLFYVMPYIEGETLRGRITREHQLPLNDGIRIATEVADALEYAHKRHVVHRDIKPENILLHEGRALVSDFGIALAVAQAGGGRLTQTGLSLGTPQYMSPEQATGERDIDARSDIYSLGAVTYEMLTGEPPFTGPSAQAIVAKVITTDPPSLIAKRRSIPPHVEAAVLTALEKMPADRFSSAAQFAEALADPSRARVGTTAGQRLAPAARWRSIDWKVTAAASVATLIIGATAGWVARRPSPAPERSARFVLGTDTTHRLATRCCSSSVAISPDGRLVIYGAATGAVAVIVRRSLDELEDHVIPGTEQGRNPFISPDGKWVGFEQGGTTRGGYSFLRKIPIEGGAAVTIAELDGPLAGATWMPDGTIVYAQIPGTRQAQGLFRVSADGGTPASITKPDSAQGEVEHHHPKGIPGTDLVLFSILSDNRTTAATRVGILSIQSGKITRAVPGLEPQYSRGFLFVGTPDGGVAAQRFDPRTGTASGPTTRVAEELPARGGPVDYAVADDGTLIYMQGIIDASLSLVGRDNATQVIPIRIPRAGHFDNPRFSPDGRRIAVAASLQGLHQLFVLHLDAGTNERLTFSAQTEHIEWTRDGRGLIYVTGDTAIATQAADRSGTEQILWRGDGRLLARVTGFGPWLAFMAGAQQSVNRGVFAKADILVLHRDSTVPRPYLATPFHESVPAISPDGRWLAYVSNETGRAEVHVAAFPDATAGRQIVSTEGGGEPQWSRNGRGLYYRTRAGDIVEVSYRTSPTFGVISRRVLFRTAADVSDDGADFDVNPTGDRFVTTESLTGRARLVVALNAVPAR